MNVRRNISAFAVITMGALYAQQANAQGPTCTGTPSCTATVGTTLTIPTLWQLSASASTIPLSPPVAANLGGSAVSDPGPTLTVKSNTAWKLTIAAAAANFTYVSGGQVGVKPASDLKWSKDATNFTALSTTAADVLAGQLPTNSIETALSFKTSYVADFSDASNRQGAYSLNVVFTLSAP